MPSFNKVILMGNITRDIEVKYTPSGSAVATIGLAVNEKYKTKNGDTKDETVFVDVDIWGNSAEIVAQYLAKGDPILIEGKLKLDSWEDKQSGQQRSRLKVTCLNFQMLGKNTAGESKGKPVRSTGQPKPDNQQDDWNDDEVPF